ncbi:unnamed protein product [Arctogadus glacialis]
MSHAVLTTGMEDGMERNTAPGAATDGGCVAKGTSEDVLGRRPVTTERATREKEDKVADGGPSYSRELSVAVELLTQTQGLYRWRVRKVEGKRVRKRRWSTGSCLTGRQSWTVSYGLC